MIITRPTETIYYGLGHRPGRTRVTIMGGSYRLGRNKPKTKGRAMMTLPFLLFRWRRHLDLNQGSRFCGPLP